MTLPPAFDPPARCFCGKEFTLRAGYREHAKDRHVFEFHCGYCGRIYIAYYGRFGGEYEVWKGDEITNERWPR